MNTPGIASKPLLLLFAACLLPLSPHPARAASPGEEKTHLRGREFDVLAITRPGLIFDAATGDLDGDGKTDLLLFHKPSKETYEKFCTVYFQRKGKFPESQSAEISLGETVSAVDVEDIDGDGRDELCAFDGGGMTVFALDGESSFESSRAFEFPNLLPSSARRVVRVDWIADLDSDGASDVILPTADGLRLFVQGKDGGFSDAKTFELPVRASVGADGGQHRIGYRLPTLKFSDFDGDGHTDVGAFDLEQMTFFLTDGAPAPGRRVASPLVVEFTKDFVAGTAFPDLNSDGIPDAALVLMSQKKNLQSETRIYFGKPDFTYGDEPSNVYSGETSLMAPMFLDADGDGKMEMLLQNINLDFGFFLNYFLRNRVKVVAEIMRFGKDGVYEDKPAVKRAIYVRASETGTEPARGIGDFDGDGLDDLAVGTDENRLAFFLSDKEKLVPARPTFELRVPAYGNMKTLDLNGDARADLIILYPQDGMSNKATLILSE